MKFNSILSIALTIASVLTLFAIAITSHQEAQAQVWTIDNCVMDKWASWEDTRGVMPGIREEMMFRDECWAEMGASLN
tara:strand:- start:595 stop:828 length:234 start_codon:yes stop_codon:yes gene_type:complete